MKYLLITLVSIVVVYFIQILRLVLFMRSESEEDFDVWDVFINTVFASGGNVKSIFCIITGLVLRRSKIEFDDEYVTIDIIELFDNVENTIMSKLITPGMSFKEYKQRVNSLTRFLNQPDNNRVSYIDWRYDILENIERWGDYRGYDKSTVVALTVDYLDGLNDVYIRMRLTE